MSRESAGERSVAHGGIEAPAGARHAISAPGRTSAGESPREPALPPPALNFEDTIALCDVCQKRPSTRTIVSCGTETSVCEQCSAEGYPPPRRLAEVLCPKS